MRGDGGRGDRAGGDRARRDAVATRAMGVFFLIGSLCFVVGPLGAYAGAVGGRGDAVTFFTGSVLFTLGGGTQCLLAVPERRIRPAGLAAWRTAWIQSAGTLLFNLMTAAAITVGAADRAYNTVVWLPDAVGSACFLISGTIFYISSPRRGLLPGLHHKGWWEPAVNLLGCILFGVSAVTGYAAGRGGTLVSAPVSNWTTTLGALCFLACAVTACGLGVTLKAPRLRQLRALAGQVADAVADAVAEQAEEFTAQVRDAAEAVAGEISEQISALEQ